MGVGVGMNNAGKNLKQLSLLFGVSPEAAATVNESRNLNYGLSDQTG